MSLGGRAIKNFDKMKVKIFQSVCLVFPKPDKCFNLCPGEHKTLVLLVQDYGVIRCFSPKLKSSQSNCKMKKELLEIMEGLHYFYDMIFKCEIVVHSNHLNLCHGDSTKHVNPLVL